MEDYIIAPDLLKEMQQDGLIDQINEDIEPKPQPLPNNTIVSVTKKMINNQINNQNNIIKNQASLIPEVSESQENAESVSINYNSSSLGNIKNRNDTKLLKQHSNYNEKNYDLIKEEGDEEADNNDNIINIKEKYEDDNYYNLKTELEEKKENINIKKEYQLAQKNFHTPERPKTEIVNTSISTEEIEPLYNINTNFTNYTLTPVNHRKLEKDKSDILLKNKKEIKEIKKLQNQLNMLTKQFSKLDKSLKHKNEELKKIKNLNENLLKENNAQKKTIDSINNEKVMLNSKIISLKDYCNKIEAKLVSGSKNQHIIEINNKLRQENESLMNQVRFYESEKNELIKNNQFLNDEILILKKEFQLNSERNINNANNNNINKSNNKNKINKIISELAKEKKNNQNLEEELNQLKYELNKKDLILQQKEEEIQSINYGKNQMTSIIAQKENEIHNLVIERDSFKRHYQECNTQLKNLKDKIKENTQAEQKNKESFKLKDQYESLIKKYINEISSLKEENNNLNNKFKEYENIMKEYDFESNNKNKMSKTLEELINKVEKEMNEQIKYKNNWINNDKEIFNKLNLEKEKSLKLINDIKIFI